MRKNQTMWITLPLLKQDVFYCVLSQNKTFPPSHSVWLMHNIKQFRWTTLPPAWDKRVVLLRLWSTFKARYLLLMWWDRVISNNPASKLWEQNFTIVHVIDVCVRANSTFAPHRWNVRCLIRCLWVVSWEGTFNFSGSWSLAAQTERRSNAEEDGGGLLGERRMLWILTNPRHSPLTASVPTKLVASN